MTIILISIAGINAYSYALFWEPKPDRLRDFFDMSGVEDMGS